MIKNENLLKNIYTGLLILLFLFIISTPVLVHRETSFIEEGTKEIVEASALIILIAIGYFINYLYKRKLIQREKELNDTLNYIGAVNLHISQISSIFDAITKYPENKKDLKFLFESLAERTLAGVKCDWVFFRIINITSGKTLTEYSKARGSAILLKNEISNNDLIEGKNPDDCKILTSNQENLNIRIFCVIPVKSLNKNQEVLIKAIINNLSMLYLIFKSNLVCQKDCRGNVCEFCRIFSNNKKAEKN